MNLDGLIVADSELGITGVGGRSVYALAGQATSLYGDACYGSLLLNEPCGKIRVLDVWAACAASLKSRTRYPLKFEKELASRPAYMGDFTVECGVENLWCLHKKSDALGLGIPVGMSSYALYEGARAALYAMEHFTPSSYRLFFGMGLMPKISMDESVFHQYYYAIKPHHDILFNPPAASAAQIWENAVAHVPARERMSQKTFVPWWPERVVFSLSYAEWGNAITLPSLH